MNKKNSLKRQWRVKPQAEKTYNFTLFLAIFSIWFVNLFDPLGSFYGMKYIAILLFFATLSLNLLIGNKLFLNKDFVYFIIFFVVYLPSYGSALALFNGGVSASFDDTSYIISAIYFLFSLSIFMKRGFEHTITIMMMTLNLLSILIFWIFIEYSLGLDYLLSWFVGLGIAYISERNYGGIIFPYIYFIISPMLIFSISYYTWKFLHAKSFCYLCMILFAVMSLFITGTRMNMLIALVSVIVTALWAKYNRNSLFLFAIFTVLGVAVLLLIDSNIINSMFNLKDVSNDVKVGYLSNYASIFNSVSDFIFGQGFNATAWSTETRILIAPGTTKTELTYFEFIRVFGIINFGVFIGFLGYFFIYIKNKDIKYGWITPASILYLLASSLNPYLFSLNGMLLLGVGIAGVCVSKNN
ncbi:hypothetical protein [Vibrio aestuarianus]|uniref:Uncharacterized protein n=1 Tax=Vibrio aestuarianus TaxID=28171 RepID=A0A9X4FCB2_9VIBR|nr:hypothetical protein [Vibrio aestuarianus]MDE1348488.1 hypothetical protein [Vibrio aestuarianus]